MAMRRLHILLSCLLATLLAVGSALPDTAQWQCRHASRVVTASDADLSSLMPCRMGNSMPGNSMPGMACCPPPPSVAKASPPRQSLSRPACQPTLSRLTALPAPATSGEQVLLRQSLLSAQAVLTLPTSVLPPVPLVRVLCPRPPPTISLCASVPTYVPGLRAPPFS